MSSLAAIISDISKTLSTGRTHLLCHLSLSFCEILGRLSFYHGLMFQHTDRIPAEVNSKLFVLGFDC